MARHEDAAAETVSCLVLFPSTDISVHARSLRNLYATHSGVLDFVSFDMHRTKPVPPTTQATPPGVPIQVVVNTFKVRLNIDPKTGAQTKYYHYDVVIKKKSGPDDGRGQTTLNSRRAREIMHQAQTVAYPHIFQGRHPVFDGRSNMYANFDVLSGSPGAQLSVNMSRQPRADQPDRGVYIITITPVNTIDLNTLGAIVYGKQGGPSQTAVQLVQALVRQSPLTASNTYNARSVFDGTQTRQLGQNSGLELCRGFFQSVRLADKRMIINIDVSTTALYAAQALPNFALNFTHTRSVSELLQLTPRDQKFKILRSVLKGVRVNVTVPVLRQPKPARPIKDIILRAGHHEFTADSQHWNVKDYYDRTHRYRLKYPDLFGVVLQGGAVIPAEICDIVPGQLFKRKIPAELMTDVHRFASKQPTQRLGDIIAGVQGPFLNYGGSQSLQQAGISIDTAPMELMGRLLPPPQVVFKESGIVKDESQRPHTVFDTTRSGHGIWNVLNQRLFKPASLTKWAIVNFSPREATDAGVIEFARKLADACANLGVSVGPPLPGVIQGSGQDPSSALKQLQSQLTSGPHGLIVLFILPDRAEDIRREVKRWGDVTVGVPTQCLKVKNIRGAQSQYLNNVAIKMNAKLGGINWISSSPLFSLLLKEPTMILGADVSHSSPGLVRPSIAAVVGTFDMELCRYADATSLQNPRQETISDLRAMVGGILVSFAERNRTLPCNIFFYRDGVSEGEYDKIKAEEGIAIDAAYADCLANVSLKFDVKPLPKPRVIFLVVGKRHHIRFFPSQRTPASYIDRSGNVTAGLCIDDTITSTRKDMPDFYLQSQPGLKGTSRSSHYILLRNDLKATKDQLQELSHMLCYNYARATRAVSIPSPVYYAHLLCSRATFYFANDLNFSDAGGSSDDAPFDLNRWKAGFGRINEAMKMKMFYV
ncbi:Piwi-domain-containing protein [Stereum hirsutum FP-91666 SS1]|uniref:Piwi-domain-containing protein n=1 Tax=Stereum hirsutum (strain FP-91666) TaxID=721885 RepID=UPI0004449539|nr:Piwi-domain-containing protein [Stereum hirsutum FP-91666 SS1]EIM82440.1 Piwi-domain-containing protein [Stereum hirsutum FP-91666 SS1]